MATKKSSNTQAAGTAGPAEGAGARTGTSTADPEASQGISEGLRRVSDYLDGGRGFAEAFPETLNLFAEPRAAQVQAAKENEAVYAERRLAAQSLTQKRAEVLSGGAEVRPYWENPKDDVRSFVIHGRVVDSRDGQGLPGITVRAADLDRRKDDLLGMAVSDGDGRFNFRFAAEDFIGKEGEDDAVPEVYLEVLDGNGKRVTRTTKSFEDKTPSGTAFVISLDPKAFPEAVAAKQRLLAGRVEEMARLQRLARSQQVKLPTPETVIPVGTLRVGVPGPGGRDNPIGSAGVRGPSPSPEPAPPTAPQPPPTKAGISTSKGRAASKPKTKK